MDDDRQALEPRALVAGPARAMSRSKRWKGAEVLDTDAMLDDLRRLVECESPSADLAAVARSAAVVAEIGTDHLGTEPDVLVLDGRTHLRWRLGAPDGRGVLLVGHHDTVWPVGTLERQPWRVTDDRVQGPGCFDMKAGLVQLFHAMRLVDGFDRTGVTILITGDEELGAPSSRELIEDEARRADAALVLEGSADGGALKTARRGVAVYRLTAVGRAAHAGLEPWTGVNASVEIATQVLAVAQLDRGPAGATVTPSVLSGGTTTNTVPSTASVSIDCRIPSYAEFERLQAALRELKPSLPGARIEVEGGLRHPPMESASSRALYDLAAAVSIGIGLDVPGSAHVGGASDGNLTAGVGTPTLDGLGAVGGGAHSVEEHVLVSTMVPRARLLAGIVGRLLDG